MDPFPNLVPTVAPGPGLPQEPWTTWPLPGLQVLLILGLAGFGFWLVQMARARRARPRGRRLAGWVLFAPACGCALAVPGYSLWQGGYRLAGLSYLLAAAGCFLTPMVLARLWPRPAAGVAPDGPGHPQPARAAGDRARQVRATPPEAARDHFRQIVEGIKDYSLSLLDSEGVITQWSPGATRMTGYPADEVLGRPVGLPATEILGRTLEQLLPEALGAPLRNQDRRVIGHREEIQVEERWPGREDGTTRDYLSHKFPLLDEHGTCWGMGLIDTDITERKKSEAALLQSQKLESLGLLAGGIAHDFNNLLGAMKGNLDLAMHEPSPDSAKPYFDAINALMDTAANLLGQMLAYAGKGEAAMRPIDLNRLVGDLVNLLRSTIARKATIRLDLHPEPLFMLADPTQIQQVVMNLVINASEALQDREGRLTIRTGKEALTPETIHEAYQGQDLVPGSHVALEISDNGIGMSPDVLAKIFDPFFTTKFEGRGLGLAAIRGIVRSHRGGIRVESTPGLGSVFTLRFPESPGGPPEELQADG